MLELWQGIMTMVDFEGERREFPPIEPGETYPAGAPAINFIDAILGVAPNGSSGELGLASMEIIEAACQSAASGENIIVRAKA
jgi:predicted dehydrogenase